MENKVIMERLIDEDYKDNILLKKDEINITLKKALKLISFNYKNTAILGSYAIKSQLYTSDVDCFEVVKMKATKIASTFQRNIRKMLNNDDIYIGDIKLGEFEPFRIIDENAYFHNSKLYRYDYKTSRLKLDTLFKNGYITIGEYNKAKSILKEKPNMEELNNIKKELRFHILRWRPQDIINGYLKLRNGKKYKLVEAIKDPSLFKLDIILYDGYKFIDISIIYDIRDKDNIKKKLKSYNTLQTLRNDISTFFTQKKYFKVLKRYYSLFKYNYNYVKTSKKQNKKNLMYVVILTKILNSQLGQLYQVKSMIDVLVFLFSNFKNISRERVFNNINLIIDKLSNIYNKNYVKIEKDIISDLLLILNNKSINEGKLLTKIYDKFDNLINEMSKKYVFKLTHMINDD